MKERITDEKWLWQDKNLLGKTLCIIDRGFNDKDPDTGIRTIRFSETVYCINITKIDHSEPKPVNYVAADYVISLEYAPSMNPGEDDPPSLTRLTEGCIDYSEKGLKRYEYYIMPKEEAIEEIKKYNRQIIKDLYTI